MCFELLVRPVSSPDGKLVAMDLEHQTLPGRSLFAPVPVAVSVPRWLLGRRDLDAEEGSLLGDYLDVVLGRDDLKDEPGILDDDAPDAHPPHAPAAHDLDLGAVHVGGAQLGGGALPARVHLAAQDLARVAQPQGVQRRVGGVPLAAARDVVEAELPALARGQGPWLEGLLALLGLALALPPAGLSCCGLGRGRRRAEEEGAVLDLVGVDALGGGGRVGAGEECLGYGVLVSG